MVELAQIAKLLDGTLSTDVAAVNSATEALDRFSILSPQFPFYLLSIATEGKDQGLRISAVTYLKNFTRKNIDGDGSSCKVSKEFKDQLIRSLLKVEPAVLKVLVEVFRSIVNTEFVKENSWPELVPDLQSAIQCSNLIKGSANSEWSTINALTVLQALLRPFQYFLNPKVAKEPVPPQLELIAKEILVPLLAVFHFFAEKVLESSGKSDVELEKALLIMCKCIYFAVRSYMPSTLADLLPGTCHDLIHVLGSLSLDGMASLEDGHAIRLKTAKRSLLIFCALVTRHRKNFDKLLVDIINCVLVIVKNSSNISKTDFLSERIISLAFDVISHVLETGPGWKLVSCHFSSLLDTAILPALVLNEKDISEWNEDADEYIRKNLPSDLDEISGWREDLFTARKSAANLLGVIALSKGPPVGISGNGSSVSSKRKKGEKNKSSNQRSSMGELLVLPFLSKFPIPSGANISVSKVLNDYFGVLMAYGGLADFLMEQKPEYTAALVRLRVLPLYTLSVSSPYLIASANWVLGELASCLPEEMSAEVYTSLLKALAMPDDGDVSCYPVRVSAAGAIAGLLENEYPPPEWLPLLQAVVGRIGHEDEENSILFQLLCTVVETGNEDVAVHIPHIISSLVGVVSNRLPPLAEPWPQVVERGFAALAVMALSWENFMHEDVAQNVSSEKWVSGRVAIARDFSALLQQAWITPIQGLELDSNKECEVSPPPSCIDDSSTMLRSIMLSVRDIGSIKELRLSELLSVWADLIADWRAWEETEDLSVFDCIKDVVNLHKKHGLRNFMKGQMPAPPAPPVQKRSIIEGISAFVSEATLQYPSATWRACSCVHLLLHLPSYSSDLEDLKKSLVSTFARAALSRFGQVRSEPCALWKPLLLAISSCYLTSPDVVEKILEKEEGGFKSWTSALGYISTSSFEPGLSDVSEVKLTVMSLVKVVERLLGFGNPDNGLLTDCFASLLDASKRLEEVQEQIDGNEDDDGAEDEDDDEDEETDYDDEDSEDDEREETEEEFLARYANAAAALEQQEIVEEGDLEDQDDGIELGCLAEVDSHKFISSLSERYEYVLRRALPSELILKSKMMFPKTF